MSKQTNEPPARATDRPRGAEVNSPAFALKLTEAFTAATKSDIAAHRKAGRAVPGVVEGRLVKVEPSGRVVNADRSRR